MLHSAHYVPKTVQPSCRTEAQLHPQKAPAAGCQQKELESTGLNKRAMPAVDIPEACACDASMPGELSCERSAVTLECAELAGAADGARGEGTSSEAMRWGGLCGPSGRA